MVWVSHKNSKPKINFTTYCISGNFCEPKFGIGKVYVNFFMKQQITVHKRCRKISENDNFTIFTSRKILVTFPDIWYEKLLQLLQLAYSNVS